MDLPAAAWLAQRGGRLGRPLPVRALYLFLSGRREPRGASPPVEPRPAQLHTQCPCGVWRCILMKAMRAHEPHPPSHPGLANRDSHVVGWMDFVLSGRVIHFMQ